jgi:hypothetical protein
MANHSITWNDREVLKDIKNGTDEIKLIFLMKNNWGEDNNFAFFIISVTY